MLEVQAHQQLKHLLRADAGQWEHQLTLSRLVGRSLRRRDQTRIQLSAGSNERWWLALLVPGPRGAETHVRICVWMYAGR